MHWQTTSHVLFCTIEVTAKKMLQSNAACLTLRCVKNGVDPLNDRYWVSGLYMNDYETDDYTTNDITILKI